MIDGFYSIYFSGVAGVGFGLLILDNGKITGVDAAGASYDGKYSLTETLLQGEIVLKAPAGAHLVTGASAGGMEQSWTIPLVFPPKIEPF